MSVFSRSCPGSSSATARLRSCSRVSSSSATCTGASTRNSRLGEVEPHLHADVAGLQPGQRVLVRGVVAGEEDRRGPGDLPEERHALTLGGVDH